MAAIRVSPGRYKDPRTGKVFNALTQQAADKMIAAQGGGKKGGSKASPLLSPEVKASVGETLVRNAPAEANVNLDKAMGVEGDAYDQASKIVNDYQKFDLGNVDQRSKLEGYEQRVQDAVFSNLTRGFDEDKAREREQLEQTLYNRGIPLNPADPQYQQHMQAFDRRYDDKMADARQRAVMYGGQEGARLAGLASGAHQQGMSDLQTFRDPTASNMALEGTLAFKTLEEQRRANKAGEANQAAAIRKSGAQSSATAEQSPFIT